MYSLDFDGDEISPYKPSINDITYHYDYPSSQPHSYTISRYHEFTLPTTYHSTISSRSDYNLKFGEMDRDAIISSVISYFFEGKRLKNSQRHRSFPYYQPDDDFSYIAELNFGVNNAQQLELVNIKPRESEIPSPNILDILYNSCVQKTKIPMLSATEVDFKMCDFSKILPRSNLKVNNKIELFEFSRLNNEKISLGNLPHKNKIISVPINYDRYLQNDKIYVMYDSKTNKVKSLFWKMSNEHKNEEYKSNYKNSIIQHVVIIGKHSELDIELYGMMIDNELYLQELIYEMDLCVVQPPEKIQSLCNTNDITPGIYRHYKNKNYTIYGTAKMLGNNEKYVVYQDENNQIWFRPLTMFLNVIHDNVTRFTLIN